MKLNGGGLEYQGGETRLISVANFCQYQHLLESLERLAGSAAGSTSGSSSYVSPVLSTCHLLCTGTWNSTCSFATMGSKAHHSSRIQDIACIQSLSLA